jgi:hypothetical protein
MNNLSLGQVVFGHWGTMPGEVTAIPEPEPSYTLADVPLGYNLRGKTVKVINTEKPLYEVTASAFFDLEDSYLTGQIVLNLYPNSLNNWGAIIIYDESEDIIEQIDFIAEESGIISPIVFTFPNDRDFIITDIQNVSEFQSIIPDGYFNLEDIIIT